MDASHFDRLVRACSGGRTRRGLLRCVAALPLLNGLVALLAGDEATAAGRRKRRKKRHKHGRPGPRHRHKPGKRCKPRSRTRLCAGRCGVLKTKHSCGKMVDCGPCHCDSTSCPDGCCDAEGRCLPNSTFSCGTGGVACAGPCLDDGTDPGLDPVEAEFLTLLNEYRIANGRQALVPNVQLAAAAEAHGLDMATRGYFSHFSPEGDGPAERVASQGYVSGALGESIAANVSTAQAVLSAFQASVGDNEIMLGIDYTEAGIGRTFKDDSADGWYWTVDLARPA